MKLAQELNLNQIQSEGLPGLKPELSSIGGIVTAALPYIFFIAGIALLFYFIIAGYGLMFSGGDPKAMASAKSKMTYAIIGFTIVFTAFWIVQIVGRFLGLQDITTTFSLGGPPAPCIPTAGRPCPAP